LVAVAEGDTWTRIRIDVAALAILVIEGAVAANVAKLPELLRRD
jgi:hypothetical protein